MQLVSRITSWFTRPVDEEAAIQLDNERANMELYGALLLHKIDHAFKILGSGRIQRRVTAANICEILRTKNIALLRALLNLQAFRGYRSFWGFFVVPRVANIPCLKLYCWAMACESEKECREQILARLHDTDNRPDAATFLRALIDETAYKAMCLDAKLHAAIENKDKEAVSKLLAMGARLQERDPEDILPRAKAEKLGYSSLSVLCFVFEKYKEIIFDLIKEGKNGVLVKKLVRACPAFAMKGFTDDKGNTILHHALLGSDLDLIKMILRQNDSLLYERNNLGFTPIERAIGCGGAYALRYFVCEYGNQSDKVVEVSPVDKLAQECHDKK